ncbi:GATA-type zinc finger protein 1 [Dermochelys coriacea]|uniref:GATA-type zinc finger protein 1 n=1 Tax=Dermochelys coriacea TaxID=27794 RepID=UPI0018E89622|nr:GATA-type zinc finger protein 1 [Dermochelys coriacea]
MEGELFLDGHPPDFSLLQQLLFPPCLEPEPGSPARGSASPGGGARPAGRPRPEPLPSTACCLQVPDSSALSFLQESAQRLPQAPGGQEEPSRAPRAQQQQPPGPAVRPGRSAPQPQGGASPLASLGTCSPMDTLSLISLHCSHLVSGAAAAASRPETRAGPQTMSPCLLPIDCNDNPSREAGAAGQEGRSWEPGVGSPSQPEPGCRRRNPRKQPAPSRSAEARDPSFQGVTLCMRLCLCQGSSDEYQLLIRPRYSSAMCGKRSRNPNPRQISLTREFCRASSSEEDQGSLSVQSSKCCASCQTRKTPLWRIAEDGTPLCNACGIRYKKYRIRCFRCWNIPKKSGKPYSRCSNCGDRLRVAVAQQRTVKRKCDDFLKSQARTLCY